MLVCLLGRWEEVFLLPMLLSMSVYVSLRGFVPLLKSRAVLIELGEDRWATGFC